MLNPMANMVSHIKRVARPNKPFPDTIKVLRRGKLSSLLLTLPLSRAQGGTAGYDVCGVPLRRPHQKRALEL